MGQDHVNNDIRDDIWANSLAGLRLFSDWPTNPLQSNLHPPRLPTGEPLLVPVMSRRQRAIYFAFVALWLLTVGIFWTWWFQPVHVAQSLTFLVTTAILGYLIVVPAYFLYLLGYMLRPNPRLPLPTHLRVALATSFVPSSESLEVLERTLRAMKAQEYADVDVWVLDEGNLPAVRALAAQLGVYYFTRRGVTRYQSKVWPFKAGYKAGNYNAWLDAIGYERYDVLVQMDTDHAPEPDYLSHMLRPFSDPRVAYVAAPSDNSGNQKQSWVINGRVTLDAPLNGPMQMGFNRRLCPIIIGSHSAIRTNALWRIGGFQQTRAEDHHNTLRLAHQGYRGVYAPDARAVGFGPTSLAEALSQERQWARSITTLLIEFFPNDGKRLPFRWWLEFMFCETWYMLYSLTLLIGLTIPALALAMNQPWAHVNYFDYLVHFELVDLTLVAIMLWTASQGWLLPHGTPVVSWQSVLLTLARWPAILAGVVEAFLLAALHRDVVFRVTFKGWANSSPLTWATILPYYLILLSSIIPAVLYIHAYPRGGAATGYVFLALLSGGFYALLIVAVVTLHWRDARRAHLHAPLSGIWTKFAGAFVAVALFCSAVYSAAPQAVNAAISASPSTPQPAVSSVDQPSGALGSYSYLLPVAAPTQSFLGAYDPAGQVSGVAGVGVQEYFIAWNSNPTQQIVAAVMNSERLHRFPLLTIEPWPQSARVKATLLRDVASGAYSAQEDSVIAGLKAVAPQQVYIRFAHEMDLYTGPYPWATSNSSNYIAAFRQFVTYLRHSGVTTAKFIWSPATLKATTLAYFPGRDVVDAVGDTILVYNGWPKHPGVPTPVANALQAQIPLARSLGLPLIVCEAGVWSPDASATLNWVAAAREVTAHTAGVAGFVYYDGPNAPVWGVQRAVNWQLTLIEARYLYEGHLRLTRTGEAG